MLDQKIFFLIRGQSFNEAKQNEMTKSFFLRKVIIAGIPLRLPYNGRWEKNDRKYRTFDQQPSSRENLNPDYGFYY